MAQKTILITGGSRGIGRAAALLAGQHPVEVGSQQDKTLVGSVQDMLGNVSEWTSTQYSTYIGHPSPVATNDFVLRGMNFGFDNRKLLQKPDFLLTYRQGAGDKIMDSRVGFRLVCEP